MSIELTVLTLNIWGIPYISKDKQIRVEAISEELSTGKYDLVSLQEVWSESDWQTIKIKVKNVLPYHHYFYSGVVGSGLCVLSKYPIDKVFYHSWRLNGYLHRIQHGDWFGGKGVGLACINVHGSLVNFYVAHLHAEYNRAFDDYLTHRIIQAFDTAQFIETTRGESVLQILAGDLNNEPEALGYRLIRSTSGLQDLYDQNLLEGTNECSKNSYSNLLETQKCPNGKRIDYILVRSSNNFKINTIKYSQPLPNRIPDQPFSYSDHEAVQAKIVVDQIVSQKEKEQIKEKLDFQTDDLKVTLSESIQICDQSLQQLGTDRKNYLMFAIAIAVVLLNSIEIQAPYGFKTLFLIFKLIMAALSIFFFAMAAIWIGIERHAILSSKLSMEILLSSIEKIGAVGDCRN